MPTFGCVTDEKSSQPMSASGRARTARARARLAVAAGQGLERPEECRRRGDKNSGRNFGRFPADGGTTFIIPFDRKTHLPAAIRTGDDNCGDSNYDLVLADWKPSTGADRRVAFRRRIGDVEWLLNYTTSPPIRHRVPTPAVGRSESGGQTGSDSATCLISGPCAVFLTRSTTADNIIYRTAAASGLVVCRPTGSMSRVVRPTTDRRVKDSL